MDENEATEVINRLRRGSRLLLGRDIQFDREVVEIKMSANGGFVREGCVIPADANAPSWRIEPLQLDELELRRFLETADYATTLQQLTRVPKDPDYPIEIVESATITRPYTILCGMSARTLEDLKNSARRTGGDALMDVRTRVIEGAGIPEIFRGPEVSAKIIAWT